MDRQELERIMSRTVSVRWWIAIPILLTTLLIGLVVGPLIARQHTPTAEMYRRAKFVGTIEEKRNDAKTDSDREFYAEWLQGLEDRGYMWGEK